MRQYLAALRKTKPGEKIPLKVRKKDGAVETLTVEIAELPTK